MWCSFDIIYLNNAEEKHIVIYCWQDESQYEASLSWTYKMASIISELSIVKFCLQVNQISRANSLPGIVRHLFRPQPKKKQVKKKTNKQTPKHLRVFINFACTESYYQKTPTSKGCCQRNFHGYSMPPMNQISTLKSSSGIMKAMKPQMNGYEDITTAKKQMHNDRNSAELH